MDAVPGIPCGDAANPITPMVEGLQIGRYFRQGLLFLKGRHNALPQPVGVAAQPQHMVDVLLGKRKSRGCLHILCFHFLPSTKKADLV